MLTIRLSRLGKKNKSQYCIVVQEKSRAPSSRFIERVGFYNPHAEGGKGQWQLEERRIKYWLSQGAKASPTVFNLLIANKVITGPSIPLGRPKKKSEEEKQIPTTQKEIGKSEEEEKDKEEKEKK